MWQVLKVATAGESHGAQLTAILEGLPAGISVDPKKIQRELDNRQKGFGRSHRMKLESDSFQFLSGVYQGKTTGSPVTIVIPNADQPFLSTHPPVTIPRPGHADLSGGLKLNEKDLRLVSERASARETACRVALGGLGQGSLP